MNRSNRLSLYDILGVPITATAPEIKAAFRSLAMKHHPDKHHNSPESTASFKAIHNAYSILSDRERRQRYDRVLGAASAPSTAVHRNTATRPTPRVQRQSLPGATVSLLLDHLNFVLWDIEDLLLQGRGTARIVDAGAKNEYVLKMLDFVDRWVLVPGGVPDYFFQARGLEPPARIGGGSSLPYRGGRGEHRPYTDITDYFYDIRKRVDKLFRKARLIDFASPISGQSLTLADCVLEAHNYCVHYLGWIEEEGVIPPFHHSHPMFEQVD